MGEELIVNEDDFTHYFNGVRRANARIAELERELAALRDVANTTHESAVAYRLCCEEAGSDRFHLREWIKAAKSRVVDARISELERENVRLRAALAPFSRFADMAEPAISKADPDSAVLAGVPIEGWLLTRHFLEARAALQPASEEARA